jgi:hypothetical protein
MADAPAVPAHRLTLTAAEFAVLSRWAGRLPPGFTGPDPGPEALRTAERELTTRGVLVADRPTAAVAANLATLTRPTASARVEVSVRDRGLLAAYAMAGPLGASLVTLADGAVELSMFAAADLGRELIRAVPGAGDLAPPRTALSLAFDAAFGDPAGPEPPPAGRLPLAALAAGGPSGGGMLATRVHLDPAQARLADQVTRRTVGGLRCVVTGPAGDGLAMAQLVWLALDGGWLALHPHPHRDGERMLTLRPATRDDIAVWAAPHLARILEVTHDGA